jgi:hypothetical protein
MILDHFHRRAHLPGKEIDVYAPHQPEGGVRAPKKSASLGCPIRFAIDGVIGVKRRELCLVPSYRVPKDRGRALTAVCAFLAASLMLMPVAGAAAPDSANPPPKQETANDKKREKDGAETDKKSGEGKEAPDASGKAEGKPETGGRSERKESPEPDNKSAEKKEDGGTASESKGIKVELKEQSEGWANLTRGREARHQLQRAHHRHRGHRSGEGSGLEGRTPFRQRLRHPRPWTDAKPGRQQPDPQ